MGNRHKPTNLKVLEGNRGKRDLPHNEPKPRPLEPKKPRNLGQRACRIWKRISPPLIRLGLLTENDGDSFGALCATLARLEEIRGLINKPDFDIILTSDKTAARIHPLFTEERHRMAQLRQQAAEFGMSPRGRTGLQVGMDRDGDGEDLFD